MLLIVELYRRRRVFEDGGAPAIGSFGFRIHLVELADESGCSPQRLPPIDHARVWLIHAERITFRRNTRALAGGELFRFSLSEFYVRPLRIVAGFSSMRTVPGKFGDSRLGCD